MFFGGWGNKGFQFLGLGFRYYKVSVRAVRFTALFIHGLLFTLCEAVTTLSYDLLCLAAASCNKCYFFCTSQFCYGTTVFVGQRVCGIMTPRGLLGIGWFMYSRGAFLNAPTFIYQSREGGYPFIHIVICISWMNPVSSRATKAKRLQKAQSARFQTPFESPHILITPQSKGGNGWICDYIHYLSPLWDGPIWWLGGTHNTWACSFNLLVEDKSKRVMS